MSFLPRVAALSLKDGVRSLAIQKGLRAVLFQIKRSHLRWFRHLTRCLLDTSLVRSSGLTVFHWEEAAGANPLERLWMDGVYLPEKTQKS